MDKSKRGGTDDTVAKMKASRALNEWIEQQRKRDAEDRERPR